MYLAKDRDPCQLALNGDSTQATTVVTGGTVVKFSTSQLTIARELCVV